MKRRTQVAIVGAGPAGLTLCHLLRLRGIECVVLEARSREYVEQRVRAGVLEQGTSDLLREIGAGERMRREGLRHRGVALRFKGRSHRIDFEALTGKAVTVYGQQEVVKDLIAAALAAGTQIRFEVKEVRLEGIDGDAPAVHFIDKDGIGRQLECDYVAGCDGFHGVSRSSIPAAKLNIFERGYPFAWLGILAHSKPVSEELIYAHHERGFALFSMRAPDITRLYVQCRANEDPADWPDERIWEELRLRLEGEAGKALAAGEIFQKGITPIRSFVAEPMRYGRLLLAGDAAHIVPPTGAKGMNLAIADVRVMAHALEAFYGERDAGPLASYSERCLRRVWKAERFSWWMTSMLHRFEDRTQFEYRLQLAELDYVTSSSVAATALAENYVGLPFEE